MILEFNKVFFKYTKVITVNFKKTPSKIIDYFEDKLDRDELLFDDGSAILFDDNNSITT